MGKCRLDSYCSVQDTVVYSSEHCNRLVSCRICEEYLDQLSKTLHFEMGSVHRDCEFIGLK